MPKTTPYKRGHNAAYYEAHKAPRPLVPHVCAHCGKEFLSRASEPGKPRYCCNSCRICGHYARKKQSDRALLAALADHQMPHL
jgi:hypothetical protein